jgi:exosortase/archaeosortase family protein
VTGSRPGAWLRIGSGGVIGAALAAVMLWRWHDVASLEAWLNAHLVDAVGLADATSIGAAVIFPLDQRWVGFMVSTGCSVALLLIPPLLLASVMVGFRRVSLVRAVTAVAMAVLLLVTVNQIRLASVVVAMQAWGFQRGYERSHVLIGSAITTAGLVAVTILFAVLLGRSRRSRGPTADVH